MPLPIGDLAKTILTPNINDLVWVVPDNVDFYTVEIMLFNTNTNTTPEDQLHEKLPAPAAMTEAYATMNSEPGVVDTILNAAKVLPKEHRIISGLQVSGGNRIFIKTDIDNVVAKITGIPFKYRQGSIYKL